MSRSIAIVGQHKPCSVCGETKHPYGFARGHRVCNVCRAAQNRETRADCAARMKAWREKRRAERGNVNQSNRPQRFEQSVAVLERIWGPYATWTREQHAQHSRLLRAASGVPEDVAPDARRVAA